MAPTPSGRPTGATIIAIIEAILGVLGALAALVLVGFGSIVGGLGGLSDVEGGAAVGGILAGLGFFFGIILALIAILYFAIAYGVWNGRGWAWMLGVIVSIIAIVFGVLGLSGGVSVFNLVQLALHRGTGLR